MLEIQNGDFTLPEPKGVVNTARMGAEPSAHEPRIPVRKREGMRKGGTVGGREGLPQSPSSGHSQSRDPPGLTFLVA